MYVRLALRNAKHACGDYLIYIATLTILSALIFSSNLLAMLDSMSASATNAHTLPFLVTLVMAVLMSYINAFMLRHRTKELATYTLLGMKQRTVSNLFFLETLVIGFVCVLLGLALGAALFYLFTGFVFQNDRMTFVVSATAVFQAIGMTLFYFCVVQMISALVIRRKINKLRIFELMYGHKQNEKVKSRKKAIAYLVIAGALFVVIVLLMVPIVSANADATLQMLCISIISTPVIAVCYFFYCGVFHYVGGLRKETPAIFYKNHRTFVAGQILSKLSSNSILTATLSLCLMVSAYSCLLSIVMFRAPVAIFDSESQLFMSISQLYICIIFIVIVFTVLGLQQIADAKENRYRYAVLQKLGADQRTIDMAIFSQIVILFTAPLLVSGMIVVASVIAVNTSLYEFLGGQNLLLTSLGFFGVLLVVLYLCYFCVTYHMVKQQKPPVTA